MGGQVGDRLLRSIDEHLLGEEIAAGIAGHGQFRESHEGYPIRFCPIRQGADLLKIGGHIGHLDKGRGCRHTKESVIFHMSD